MNQKLITLLADAVVELDAREVRVCQDANAALMLRGAADLLLEADASRTVKPSTSDSPATIGVEKTEG